MVEFAPGLALACLAIGLLCAIATEAMRDFSRSEFEELCNRRGKPALLEDVLKHDEEAVVATWTLRLAASAGFVACVVLAVESRQTPPTAWLRLVAGGSVLVALACAEVWIPRAVGRANAEEFLYRTWGAWRQLSRLLAPARWGAQLFDAVVRRLVGKQAVAAPVEEMEDEILSAVAEGHRGGALEAADRGMIEGVIELRDVLVSEIMTPRTDMVSIPLASSLEEAARAVHEAGHSRLPVYDKSRDEIVGVMHAKDLLVELARQPREAARPLPEILRKPVFVPETKPVRDLLHEFRFSRNHLAIVLDEFGGVAGLVTIEDVLEQIVGDIADEYDDAHVDDVRPLDDGGYEVLARARPGDVGERLGVDLSDVGEFDTLGGLVFHALGHIPRIGDVVETHGLRLTVLAVVRRRVERVKVEVLDASPSQPPA